MNELFYLSDEKKDISLPFSQREGIRPVKIKIQKGMMSERLKIRLWNVFTVTQLNKYEHSFGGRMSDRELRNLRSRQSQIDNLITKIWDQILNEPIDEIASHWGTICKRLKETFFDCNWYQAYEFIEFIARNSTLETERFMNSCNDVLAQEQSGYRFVNGIITSITSEIEIEAIESALSSTRISPLKPVNTHLDTASTLLFDRKNPDYRNSIKESISAIESHCKIASNNPKADFGVILKELEKNGLNPVLKSAFNKLYGYTSSSNGIRHGAIKDSEVSYSLAKFMLVACSAFVNYLIDINMAK